MDKSNLRNRSTKADALEQKSMQNKKTEKKNNKKSSWLSCFIVLTIFSMPILVLPVLPFLRIDSTIQAYYIKLSECPKFEGKLKENNLLQDALLFAKGKLSGPETILFVNDTMYTGLNNGQLVRVDANGNVHNIVRIGDAHEEQCNSLKTKRECGRPLGLRYKSNFIYLADAYLGIYKVDLRTNEKHVVLAANDKKNNEELKFIDDLDVDEDNIYFTVSSKKRELHESVELHFESSSDGRVFQYNEKTKELKLLMENLVFPNGIQLTPNKDAILVAEHGRTRLIKYYLKGKNQGKTELFINLPGFPDNLRLSDRGTLFVAIVVTRSPSKPTVHDLLGEYPIIRTFLGRILNIEKIMLKLPRYALALEVDLNSGSILRSWHDPTGKILKFVTCITEHQNKLYLGSFIDDYIGIVNY